MRDFLCCVVESVAENGIEGLANMVPGGAFAVAVAKGAWEKWRRRRTSAEQAAEIQRLAQATLEQVKSEANEVVREVFAAKHLMPLPPQLASLDIWLAGIPEATRTSLRRADDPSGRSLPPGLVFRDFTDVEKLLPPVPKLLPGALLPERAGWVLDRLLGIGGYGEVWLTRNPRYASLCGAVKFCHGEHARELQHEAGVIDRVLSARQHPGVVLLKDVHLEGSSPWLMYEYIAGGTLADWVYALQRVTPERRQAQIVVGLKQLVDAVGFFHQLDPPIIHRDLKPSNILLNKTSKKLQITDFGIGAISASASLRAEARGETTHSGRLFTSMRGSHTRLYASPQQASGAEPDPRDDIHALGVIGYQMFTGNLTTAPGRDMDDDLHEAGASGELIELLGKCVAQKAERRPKNAAELAARLTVIGQTPSVSQTHPRVIEPESPVAKAVEPEPPVVETETLDVLCREACHSLIVGDISGWDHRWAAIRKGLDAEQLKATTTRLMRDLDAELPTLVVVAREALRTACFECAVRPDHHLLAPTSLNELDSLLGAEVPAMWQGYTCFTVMGPDDKNWLLSDTKPFRFAMRERVRQHVVSADLEVFAAYLKNAKDYVSIIPGFLYDFLRPFRPDSSTFMSRLTFAGADIIEPADWVMLLSELDIYGEKIKEWSGFLLKDNRLAILLTAFGCDPAARQVWDRYLNLLTPQLFDGNEWEHIIYTELNMARELLRAKKISLHDVASPEGVRNLEAADARLNLTRNPSSSGTLEPDCEIEAINDSGMKPPENLRREYKTIDAVPTPVLVEAILGSLTEFGAMPPEDLIVAAFKRLGFKRTGPRIRERIAEAINRLLEENRMHLRSDETLGPTSLPGTDDDFDIWKMMGYPQSGSGTSSDEQSTG